MGAASDDDTPLRSRRVPAPIGGSAPAPDAAGPSADRAADRPATLLLRTAAERGVDITASQGAEAARRFRLDSPEAWTAVNDLPDIEDLREDQYALFMVALHLTDPSFPMPDVSHPYDAADADATGHSSAPPIERTTALRLAGLPVAMPDTPLPGSLEAIAEESVLSLGMTDARGDRWLQVPLRARAGKHKRREAVPRSVGVHAPSRRTTRTHKQPREFWMDHAAAQDGASSSGTDNQPASAPGLGRRPTRRQNTSNGTASNSGLCGTQ